MKFVYEYRTSDNAKHTGVISASDRETAYAELKKQGVKPCRFAEAPGVFNKLFGKGKRWIVIGLLAVLLLLTLFVYQVNVSSLRDQLSPLESTVRRQVIGDQAIIEKGIATGWADFFESEGDRFLASFAIPGVPAAVRSTTEDELRRAVEATVAGSRSEDGIEARQIRAIVMGMKSDIRRLMNDGWTLKDVGTALVNRQEKEIGYYQGAKTEIETAKRSGVSEIDLLALWERRNASLRQMGIRPVSFPQTDD